MKLETAIKKMGKETLIAILLRIISQFPVIKESLIRMLNSGEKE